MAEIKHFPKSRVIGGRAQKLEGKLIDFQHKIEEKRNLYQICPGCGEAVDMLENSPRRGLCGSCNYALYMIGGLI